MNIDELKSHALAARRDIVTMSPALATRAAPYR